MSRDYRWQAPSEAGAVSGLLHEDLLLSTAIRPDPGCDSTSLIADVQELLIMSIGTTENEISEVYIRMQDWEKLTLVRSSLAKSAKAGFKGTTPFRVCSSSIVS